MSDLKYSIGQNPTGGTLSVQRRKEIYAVCVMFDVIIMEDDPYWYLQYPSANPAKQTLSRKPQMTFDLSNQGSLTPQKSSGYAFLPTLSSPPTSQSTTRDALCAWTPFPRLSLLAAVSAG